MRVIFLDFDGVITTPSSRYTIIPEKVKMIEELCDKTNAKIVISSSWRPYGNNQSIDDILNSISRNPYNEEHYPYFKDYIIGCTNKGIRKMSDYYNPRGQEILEYIQRYPEITQYVIIDDDDINPVEDELKHIVYTNHFQGIEEEDINKAYNILNGDL